MSDTVLTQEQLENVFSGIVSSVFVSSTASPVRIGWAQDGQPAWEIADDVAFILVNYEDSPIAQQMETEYDNGVQTQTHIAPIRLTIDVYGPNSFDNASLIRSSLYLQSTRDTLSSSNLALIPSVPMPIRAPEIYNGQWWPHVSFYARFYELVQRQESIDYIASANVTTEVSN